MRLGVYALIIIFIFCSIGCGQSVKHGEKKGAQYVMSSTPSYSPDGRYVIFGMAIDGVDAICRYDRSNGAINRLTDSNTPATFPAISPNSRIIAYVSIPCTNGDDGNDLWVMDVNGKNKRMVGERGYSRGCPTFMNDNILYSMRLSLTNEMLKKRTGFKSYKYSYVDLSSRKTIEVDEVSGNSFSQFWFLDDKMILLSSDVNLFIMNIKTRNKNDDKDLTEYADWFRVALTHDKKRMVYTKTPYGTYTDELYIRDVVGGTPLLITKFSNARTVSLAVSPDTKKVLILQDRGDGYVYAPVLPRHQFRFHLMEINIDGSGLREIVIDKSNIQQIE